MKINSFFSFLILVFALGFCACSADDAVDKLTGGCYGYQDDLQEYLNAVGAYSENPTVENCEAYKNAMINFYESYKDCAFYKKGEYQDSIEEIKNMDCSQ